MRALEMPGRLSRANNRAVEFQRTRDHRTLGKRAAGIERIHESRHLAPPVLCTRRSPVARRTCWTSIASCTTSRSCSTSGWQASQSKESFVTMTRATMVASSGFPSNAWVHERQHGGLEVAARCQARDRVRATPFKVTKIRATSVFSNRNRSQWRGTGRSGGTLSRTQPC